MPRLPKQELLNRNSIPSDKADLFLALQPKVLRFFMEWLKNGGKTAEAYMVVNRIKDRQRAMLNGQNIIFRHPEIKRALYEMWGFSETDIIKTLNEATKATRQTIYKNKVYESPDHYARMKAVELAQKFKEATTTEKNEGGTKVNILVVNDPAKGIFRVEDQSPS